MKQRQFKQQNVASVITTVEKPIIKVSELSITILVTLIVSLMFLSCSNQKKEKTAALSVSETKPIQMNSVVVSQTTYEIVPNDKVCMVNDRYMGVEQIPIDVEGITYYGCCQGCVEKLQKNIDNVRFGSNPIDDTKIDKANAVIVQDKSKGNVFYFASKEDAQNFINKNRA
ncbi:hypothetical protein KUL118_30020 [Tenacibaculum sp. KUL118]|uniref:hypothetical protein n=2 Tax=unclassified Tenacibaculum TaxID=2635139 RepID=UPI0012E5D55E|nr:hypothetical protein KUL118_30020 [Tenacibaculum sp. KUL118]